MLFVPTAMHVYILLGFFGVGALMSLVTVLGTVQRVARMVSYGAAVLGSAYGALLSLSILASGTALTLAHASPFTALTYSIRIDALAAFFMLIISLGSLAASVYGYGYSGRDSHIRPGVFGFFYTLFIGCLYLVVMANNALFFLIAWEGMSLASYFLIVHEHHEQEHVRAGFLYILMTHLGTAFLAGALITLGHAVGSYDFDVFRTSGADIAPFVRHSVLVAALIGLAIKAGAIPFHVWLPEAHPAAPSHVSALLSGVMLKMAMFMLIRFFFDFFGLPTEVWWGVLILILGSVSALFGVLYALAQDDLKRLLAYSSVENIGIILMGIGTAGIFAGIGEEIYAGIALVAALFHSLNHAIFKGLLFMGAGAALQLTGVRTMERYGGLIRALPYTAGLFLVGSLAIAGLPPLNGFASELLTFQALIVAVATSTLYLKALFVGSIGVLALTAGLAAASVVKAYGMTFLARPRMDTALWKYRRGQESPTMLIGMGIAALLIGWLGLFADRVVGVLTEIVGSLGLGTHGMSHAFFTPMEYGMTLGGPLAVTMSFILLSLAVVLLFTYTMVQMWSGMRRESQGRVWACGAPVELPAFIGAEPRAEITSGGFSRTITMVFRSLVRMDEHTTFGVGGVQRVDTTMRDVIRARGYVPIRQFFLYIATRVRAMQNGNVNLYLLYMFVTLCLLLIVAL
jgi:hydrogenase-4 component B